MEPFHAANYRAALADYVDYFERDDVLLHLLAALRRRATTTARDWNDESLKKGTAAPLPADGLACLALRYDLLRTAVKSDKFDLRYFVSCLFPGSHLNEKLMHWKRLVVHPLAADVRRLGELVLERLPATEWVETDDVVPAALEALAREAFGPRSWTDADDEATTRAEEAARARAQRSALGTSGEPAPAAHSTAISHPPEKGDSPTAAAPDLEEALAALGRAVASSGQLDADERHDLALEVRILALEAKKSSPEARDRLRSRLDAIGARPEWGAPVARVRSALGPRP